MAALSLGLLTVPSLLRITYANASPQTLPFSQNWSNTGLITTNDIWSGVPGIEGFLGQNLTSANDVDPQTVLGTSATANDLDVIANQTATTSSNGGVAEFHTTSQPAALGGNNPTIGLQGSATADAPHIILYLNTTGQMNVNIAYNLRDIDCTTDNAQQQVALHRDPAVDEAPNHHRPGDD